MILIQAKQDCFKGDILDCYGFLDNESTSPNCPIYTIGENCHCRDILEQDNKTGALKIAKADWDNSEFQKAFFELTEEKYMIQDDDCLILNNKKDTGLCLGPVKVSIKMMNFKSKPKYPQRHVPNPNCRRYRERLFRLYGRVN